MGCAPSRHREDPQGSQPSKTNSVTSQQPVANASMVTTAPAKESETEAAPSAKPGLAAESANKIETENTPSTKPATTEQSTTETETTPSIISANATESATSLPTVTTTAASAPEIKTATETEIGSSASKFEFATTQASETTTKIETATPTANETATKIEIALIASASEPETAIINSKSASKIEAVATTTTADTTSKLETASATEAFNRTLAFETALPVTDTKTATKTETALTTTPIGTASQAETATITVANMSASVANAVAACPDTNPNTKLEAATISQALNTATEPGSERENQSPNPVEITPGCETALDTPIDNTTMIETVESSVPDAFATSVAQHAVEDAADSDSIHEGDVSLDEELVNRAIPKHQVTRFCKLDVTKSIILKQHKDNKTQFKYSTRRYTFALFHDCQTLQPSMSMITPDKWVEAADLLVIERAKNAALEQTVAAPKEEIASLQEYAFEWIWSLQEEPETVSGELGFEWLSVRSQTCGCTAIDAEAQLKVSTVVGNNQDLLTNRTWFGRLEARGTLWGLGRLHQRTRIPNIASSS